MTARVGSNAMKGPRIGHRIKSGVIEEKMGWGDDEVDGAPCGQSDNSFSAIEAI
jgi:hypothetical protein